VENYHHLQKRTQARGAAKERQGMRTDLEHSGKLPKSDSRETIAATVGVSGKTYEKAKAVYEAAEEKRSWWARLRGWRQ